MVVVEAGAGAPARLAAALAASPVASVVIIVPEGTPVPEVQALIAPAQAAGAAALICDDAHLARTLKADGVHLSAGNAKAYGEAREIVGARGIVGVDAGRSRHEAMVAGEGGAEYVAFGIPAHVDDREKAHRRRCELIAWWSEIFEVPVVAFDVMSAGEAGQLAAAGADFIALTLPAREPPAASGELVRAAHAAIAGEVTA
ncbi:MAG: thiamine phosphate synthase [Hyphomicrobiaceae bacterium]